MTIKGPLFKNKNKNDFECSEVRITEIGKFKQTFSEIQLDSTKNIFSSSSDHRLFIVIENIDNYFLACKI